MSSNALEECSDEGLPVSISDIVGVITDIAHKMETLCLMLKYFGWNEPVEHLEAAIKSMNKLMEMKKARMQKVES